MNGTLKSLLNVLRRLPLAAKWTTAALLVLMGVTITVMSRTSANGRGHGHLWVWTLVNMNVILAVVVALLLSRNLIKWVFEGPLLGSLRTRLVAAFVGFSLIPAVLLFLVASELLTNSVDGWFAPRVDEAMSDAAQVAHERYRELRDDVAADAGRVARLLPPDWREMPVDSLKGWLEAQRSDWKFSGLALLRGGDGERAKRGATAGAVALPGRPPTEGYLHATGTPYGELLQAAVPIAGGDALVAERLIPAQEISRLSTITGNFETFSQLSSASDPIKTAYRLSFLTITLVILFSATWFGFYIARSITNPLQQLVEGTRAVAAGDLAVQVPPVSRDEVGELVAAFNAMTGELARTNRRLTSTNLELESRRAYMEAILENAATGVIALDASGRVSLFNRAAAEILGLEQEQVRDRPYREAFGDMTPQAVGQLADLLRDPQSGAQRSTAERQVTIMRGGVPLTLQVNARRLALPEGESLGLVLVFDNLTELIRVQKDAAWREVAQRLAHEIKNPLTPIQLSVQRMYKWFEREGQTPPPLVAETTATVLEQVDALKRLVDEFSLFARMPHPHLAPASIGDLATDVAILYRQAYPGVEVTIDIGAMGELRLDAEQMRRVFTNLFENAVQAMGGQGRIHIAGEVASDDWVAIRFADTGPGLPEGGHDKVFQPYFSRREGGTGLGLAITSRIIEEHGGHIRAEDGSPGGAVFVVLLPRHAPATA
ncbi:MAG: ATP-binding protein [Nitrospirota bacterium]|nr:ATP-binding protein [Nitrospirota bacterium]